MAMKETVGSLRAYLFVAAGLQGISSIPILFQPGASLLALLVGVVGGVFALAYLYLAARLPDLLTHASGRITAVLYAGGAYQILLFILFVALTGVQGGDIARLAIGLLLIWYLVGNVRRLATTPGATAVVSP